MKERLSECNVYSINLPRHELLTTNLCSFCANSGMGVGNLPINSIQIAYFWLHFLVAVLYCFFYSVIDVCVCKEVSTSKCVNITRSFHSSRILSHFMKVLVRGMVSKEIEKWDYCLLQFLLSFHDIRKRLEFLVELLCCNQSMITIIWCNMYTYSMQTLKNNKWFKKTFFEYLQYSE